MRVLWTARRSNQSILKEIAAAAAAKLLQSCLTLCDPRDSISPEYSLEGLMLKLKLQYFGHLMQRMDSLEETDARKD